MWTPLEIAEASLAAAAAAGLAVGGYAYASTWPASRLFGRALTAPQNPAGGPPEIALTFDDGPHPRWTPQLLEILSRHNVRATFFLLGKYAAFQHPLVREIHQAGHLVGNHSWTHPNLAVTSLEKTRAEVTRTSAELEQIIGEPIRYFRPPFGKRRPATFGLARELGLVPVLWNGMAADWAATNPAPVTAKLSRLIEGHNRRGFASNLVLHDGGHLTLEVDRSSSIKAAGQLIERFLPTHRFVRLDAWPQF